MKKKQAPKEVKKAKKTLVAIIMGSKTDLKTMSGATVSLKEFAISYTIEIVSAHRTPEAMVTFAKSAVDRGIKVIIAGAGAAAHLPGMVACLTPLPVIGVPVTVNSLKGLDALLAIAQMPKGVPVASVAIDNGYNAGLLAVRMLALSDEKLMKKMGLYQSRQKMKVKAMNQELKSKTKK